MHARTHARTHARKHARAHARARARTHRIARMAQTARGRRRYACECVSACIINTRTHTHTHTQRHYGIITQAAQYMCLYLFPDPYPYTRPYMCPAPLYVSLCVSV